MGKKGKKKKIGVEKRMRKKKENTNRQEMRVKG